MRLSLTRIVVCAAFAAGTGLAVPAVNAAAVPSAALHAQAELTTPAPAVYLPQAPTTDLRAGEARPQAVQYYRYRRYGRPYRRSYRRYYGPPRWGPPRWGYAPPPRYGYSRPRYRYSRPGGGHVSWCLNRYRSYNPRTDSYLGYDGRYHRCRSPYR